MCCHIHLFHKKFRHLIQGSFPPRFIWHINHLSPHAIPSAVTLSLWGRWQEHWVFWNTPFCSQEAPSHFLNAALIWGFTLIFHPTTVAQLKAPQTDCLLCRRCVSFQKQLQGCCAVSAHLQGAGCLKCSPASASSPGWETTTGYTHLTTFSKICHSTVKDCSKAKANAALRISIDHTTMFILESDELSDHFCSSISSVDYFDFTFESPSCPIKALNCNKAEQCSWSVFISAASPTSGALTDAQNPLPQLLLCSVRSVRQMQPSCTLVDAALSNGLIKKKFYTV